MKKKNEFLLSSLAAMLIGGCYSCSDEGKDVIQHFYQYDYRYERTEILLFMAIFLKNSQKHLNIPIF